MEEVVLQLGRIPRHETRVADEYVAIQNEHFLCFYFLHNVTVQFISPLVVVGSGGLAITLAWSENTYLRTATGGSQVL